MSEVRNQWQKESLSWWCADWERQDGMKDDDRMSSQHKKCGRAERAEKEREGIKETNPSEASTHPVIN